MNVNEQKEILQRFMESKMSGRPGNPHDVVKLQRCGLVDKKGEKLTTKGEKLYTSQLQDHGKPPYSEAQPLGLNLGRLEDYSHMSSHAGKAL